MNNAIIEKQKAESRKEVRVIFALCHQICFYCLMYIPTIVMTTLDVIGYDYSDVEVVVMDVSLYLYLASSVFNPIVTLNFKFKEKLCEMFARPSESNNSHDAATMLSIPTKV